jgi:hypothetical protein
MSGITLGLLWKISFLGLDRGPMAYDVVPHCDQAGFLMKMSFNELRR